LAGAPLLLLLLAYTSCRKLLMLLTLEGPWHLLLRCTSSQPLQLAAAVLNQQQL
jgi:hypothetical protein